MFFRPPMNNQHLCLSVTLLNNDIHPEDCVFLFSTRLRSSRYILGSAERCLNGPHGVFGARGEDARDARDA